MKVGVLTTLRNNATFLIKEKDVLLGVNKIKIRRYCSRIDLKDLGYRTKSAEFKKQ